MQKPTDKPLSILGGILLTVLLMLYAFSVSAEEKRGERNKSMNGTGRVDMVSNDRVVIDDNLLYLDPGHTVKEMVEEDKYISTSLTKGMYVRFRTNSDGKVVSILVLEKKQNN